MEKVFYTQGVKKKKKVPNQFKKEIMQFLSKLCLTKWHYQTNLLAN